MDGGRFYGNGCDEHKFQEDAGTLNVLQECRKVHTGGLHFMQTVQSQRDCKTVFFWGVVFCRMTLEIKYRK